MSEVSYLLCMLGEGHSDSFFGDPGGGGGWVGGPGGGSRVGGGIFQR